MNKEILAVIVSYNPEESIIKLYNSIKYQVDKLIIVDNFTTNEESKQYLKDLSKYKDIDIIYNDKNYGIAKALNQGAKYAIDNGYKWLLTLDQDSKFMPNTYKLILQSYELMDDKDKVMLVAPQYKERINYNKNKKIDFSLPTLDKIKWKKESFIITSGSLIKTKCFEYIGFFEEKLFIDRVDFDFTLRIKINGFFSKIAKNIFFIHELGKARKNFIKVYNYTHIRRYYIARNSVYMFKKYFTKMPIQMFIGILRSGIFFSCLKVILFEDDKIHKIKQTYKGFFDGFWL